MISKVLGVVICLAAGILFGHFDTQSRFQPNPESNTSNMNPNNICLTFLLGAGIFVLTMVLHLHRLMGSKRPSTGNPSKNTPTESAEAILPENQGGQNLLPISGPENANDDYLDDALRSENEKLRNQLCAMTNMQGAYRARLLDSMETSRRWEEAAIEKMQDRMQRLDCNHSTEVILIE